MLTEPQLANSQADVTPQAGYERPPAQLPWPPFGLCEVFGEVLFGEAIAAEVIFSNVRRLLSPGLAGALQEANDDFSTECSLPIVAVTDDRVTQEIPLKRSR